MARTFSNNIQMGTEAPHFELLNVMSGQKQKLTDLKSETATLIMFICNHCPFVKHINAGLIELAKLYQPRGIGFIAISSNDAIAYPDDSPEKMKTTAVELGYPFPYLYDESQSVAKAYDAACTPDFFLYDKDLKLVYHGQMDDSRPSNDIPVTGKDLAQCFDQLIRGETIDSNNQIPSIGCNIKWKK